MVEGEVVTWWQGLFSHLHPLLLWHWIVGSHGWFYKLYRNVKSGFDPRFRRRRRLLSWVELAAGRDVVDLAMVWRDGSILCEVIHRACPSACQGWEESQSKDTFRHAQSLVYRCLQLDPAFSEQELCQSQLTPNIEKRLFRYVQAIKLAISKRHLSRSLEDESDGEPLIAEEYIARGMGLIMASRRQPAIFYIYSRDGSSLMDIHIEIRGPGDDFGSALVSEGGSSISDDCSIPIEYKVTPEYLRASYQPRSVGHHELSVSRHGYIVPGSPFVVTVDEITERQPHKRFNSIEWFTEDEERRQNYLQEKKKNAKVKLRVVDFVTEKMILTEEGKLVKMSPDVCVSSTPPDFPAPSVPQLPNSLELPPSISTSPTRSCESRSCTSSRNRQSISPKSRNKRGNKCKWANVGPDAMKYVLVKPQKTQIKRVSDAASQVTLEIHNNVFQDKCKRIVNVCNYLLRHCPRQKSLEIISGAGHILQTGMPKKITTFKGKKEPASVAEQSDEDDEVFVTSPCLSPTVKTIMCPKRCRSISLTFVNDKLTDSIENAAEQSQENAGSDRRGSQDSGHLAAAARKIFRSEGNTKSSCRRMSFSSITTQNVDDLTLKCTEDVKKNNSIAIRDDITSSGDFNIKEINKSETTIIRHSQVNAEVLEIFTTNHEENENTLDFSQKSTNPQIKTEVLETVNSCPLLPISSCEITTLNININNLDSKIKINSLSKENLTNPDYKHQINQNEDNSKTKHPTSVLDRCILELQRNGSSKSNQPHKIVPKQVDSKITKRVPTTKGNLVKRIIAHFEASVGSEIEKDKTELVNQDTYKFCIESQDTVIKPETRSYVVLDNDSNAGNMAVMHVDDELQIEYLKSIGASVQCIPTVKPKIELFEKGVIASNQSILKGGRSSTSLLESIEKPLLAESIEHVFRAEPAIIVSKHYAELHEISLHTTKASETVIFGFKSDACVGFQNITESEDNNLAGLEVKSKMFAETSCNGNTIQIEAPIKVKQLDNLSKELTKAEVDFKSIESHRKHTKTHADDGHQPSEASTDEQRFNITESKVPHSLESTTENKSKILYNQISIGKVINGMTSKGFINNEPSWKEPEKYEPTVAALVKAVPKDPDKENDGATIDNVTTSYEQLSTHVNRPMSASNKTEEETLTNEFVEGTCVNNTSSNYTTDQILELEKKPFLENIGAELVSTKLSENVITQKMSVNTRVGITNLRGDLTTGTIHTLPNDFKESSLNSMKEESVIPATDTTNVSNSSSIEHFSVVNKENSLINTVSNELRKTNNIAPSNERDNSEEIKNELEDQVLDLGNINTEVNSKTPELTENTRLRKLPLSDLATTQFKTESNKQSELENLDTDRLIQEEKEIVPTEITNIGEKENPISNSVADNFSDPDLKKGAIHYITTIEGIISTEESIEETTKKGRSRKTTIQDFHSKGAKKEVTTDVIETLNATRSEVTHLKDFIEEEKSIVIDKLLIKTTPDMLISSDIVEKNKEINVKLAEGTGADASYLNDPETINQMTKEACEIKENLTVLGRKLKHAKNETDASEPKFSLPHSSISEDIDTVAIEIATGSDAEDIVLNQIKQTILSPVLYKLPTENVFYLLSSSNIMLTENTTTGSDLSVTKIEQDQRNNDYRMSNNCITKTGTEDFNKQMEPTKEMCVESVASVLTYPGAAVLHNTVRDILIEDITTKDNLNESEVNLKKKVTALEVMSSHITIAETTFPMRCALDLLLPQNCMQDFENPVNNERVLKSSTETAIENESVKQEVKNKFNDIYNEYSSETLLSNYTKDVYERPIVNKLTKGDGSKGVPYILKQAEQTTKRENTEKAVSDIPPSKDFTKGDQTLVVVNKLTSGERLETVIKVIKGPMNESNVKSGSDCLHLKNRTEEGQDLVLNKLARQGGLQAEDEVQETTTIKRSEETISEKLSSKCVTEANLPPMINYISHNCVSENMREVVETAKSQSNEISGTDIPPSKGKTEEYQNLLIKYSAKYDGSEPAKDILKNTISDGNEEFDSDIPPPTYHTEEDKTFVINELAQDNGLETAKEIKETTVRQLSDTSGTDKNYTAGQTPCPVINEFAQYIGSESFKKAVETTINEGTGESGSDNPSLTNNTKDDKKYVKVEVALNICSESVKDVVQTSMSKLNIKPSSNVLSKEYIGISASKDITDEDQTLAKTEFDLNYALKTVKDVVEITNREDNEESDNRTSKAIAEEDQEHGEYDELENVKEIVKSTMRKGNEETGSDIPTSKENTEEVKILSFNELVQDKRSKSEKENVETTDVDVNEESCSDVLMLKNTAEEEQSFAINEQLQDDGSTTEKEDADTIIGDASSESGSVVPPLKDTMEESQSLVINELDKDDGSKTKKDNVGKTVSDVNKDSGSDILPIQNTIEEIKSIAINEKTKGDGSKTEKEDAETIISYISEESSSAAPHLKDKKEKGQTLAVNELVQDDGPDIEKMVVEYKTSGLRERSSSGIVPLKETIEEGQTLSINELAQNDSSKTEKENVETTDFDVNEESVSNILPLKNTAEEVQSLAINEQIHDDGSTIDKEDADTIMGDVSGESGLNIAPLKYTNEEGHPLVAKELGKVDGSKTEKDDVQTIKGDFRDQSGSDFLPLADTKEEGQSLVINELDKGSESQTKKEGVGKAMSGVNNDSGADILPIQKTIEEIKFIVLNEETKGYRSTTEEEDAETIISDIIEESGSDASHFKGKKEKGQNLAVNEPVQGDKTSDFRERSGSDILPLKETIDQTLFINELVQDCRSKTENEHVGTTVRGVNEESGLDSSPLKDTKEERQTFFFNELAEDCRSDIVIEVVENTTGCVNETFGSDIPPLKDIKVEGQTLALNEFAQDISDIGKEVVKVTMSAVSEESGSYIPPLPSKKVAGEVLVIHELAQDARLDIEKTFLEITKGAVNDEPGLDILSLKDTTEMVQSLFVYDLAEDERSTTEKESVESIMIGFSEESGSDFPTLKENTEEVQTLVLHERFKDDGLETEEVVDTALSCVNKESGIDIPPLKNTTNDYELLAINELAQDCGSETVKKVVETKRSYAKEEPGQDILHSKDIIEEVKTLVTNELAQNGISKSVKEVVEIKTSYVNEESGHDVLPLKDIKEEVKSLIVNEVAQDDKPETVIVVEATVMRVTKEEYGYDIPPSDDTTEKDKTFNINKLPWDDGSDTEKKVEETTMREGNDECSTNMPPLNDTIGENQTRDINKLAQNDRSKTKKEDVGTTMSNVNEESGSDISTLKDSTKAAQTLIINVLDENDKSETVIEVKETTIRKSYVEFSSDITPANVSTEHNKSTDTNELSQSYGKDTLFVHKLLKEFIGTTVSEGNEESDLDITPSDDKTEKDQTVVINELSQDDELNTVNKVVETTMREGSDESITLMQPINDTIKKKPCNVTNELAQGDSFEPVKEVVGTTLIKDNEVSSSGMLSTNYILEEHNSSAKNKLAQSDGSDTSKVTIMSKYTEESGPDMLHLISTADENKRPVLCEFAQDVGLEVVCVYEISNEAVETTTGEETEGFNSDFLYLNNTTEEYNIPFIYDCAQDDSLDRIVKKVVETTIHESTKESGLEMLSLSGTLYDYESPVRKEIAQCAEPEIVFVNQNVKETGEAIVRENTEKFGLNVQNKNDITEENKSLFINGSAENVKLGTEEAVIRYGTEESCSTVISSPNIDLNGIYNVREETSPTVVFSDKLLSVEAQMVINIRNKEPGAKSIAPNDWVQKGTEVVSNELGEKTYSKLITTNTTTQEDTYISISKSVIKTVFKNEVEEKTDTKKISKETDLEDNNVRRNGSEFPNYSLKKVTDESKVEKISNESLSDSLTEKYSIKEKTNTLFGPTQTNSTEDLTSKYIGVEVSKSNFYKVKEEIFSETKPFDNVLNEGSNTVTDGSADETGIDVIAYDNTDSINVENEIITGSGVEDLLSNNYLKEDKEVLVSLNTIKKNQEPLINILIEETGLKDMPFTNLIENNIDGLNVYSKNCAVKEITETFINEPLVKKDLEVVLPSETINESSQNKTVDDVLKYDEETFISQRPTYQTEIGAINYNSIILENREHGQIEFVNGRGLENTVDKYFKKDIYTITNELPESNSEFVSLLSEKRENTDTPNEQLVVKTDSVVLPSNYILKTNDLPPKHELTKDTILDADILNENVRYVANTMLSTKDTTKQMNIIDSAKESGLAGIYANTEINDMSMVVEEFSNENGSIVAENKVLDMKAETDRPGSKNIPMIDTDKGTTISESVCSKERQIEEIVETETPNDTAIEVILTENTANSCSAGLSSANTKNITVEEDADTDVSGLDMNVCFKLTSPKITIWEDTHWIVEKFNDTERELTNRLCEDTDVTGLELIQTAHTVIKNTETNTNSITKNISSEVIFQTKSEDTKPTIRKLTRAFGSKDVPANHMAIEEVRKESCLSSTYTNYEAKDATDILTDSLPTNISSLECDKILTSNELSKDTISEVKVLNSTRYDVDITVTEVSEGFARSEVSSSGDIAIQYKPGHISINKSFVDFDLEFAHKNSIIKEDEAKKLRKESFNCIIGQTIANYDLVEEKPFPAEDVTATRLDGDTKHREDGMFVINDVSVMKGSSNNNVLLLSDKEEESNVTALTEGSLSGFCSAKPLLALGNSKFRQHYADQDLDERLAATAKLAKMETPLSTNKSILEFDRLELQTTTDTLEYNVLTPLLYEPEIALHQSRLSNYIDTDNDPKVTRDKFCKTQTDDYDENIFKEELVETGPSVSVGGGTCDINQENKQTVAARELYLQLDSNINTPAIKSITEKHSLYQLQCKPVNFEDSACYCAHTNYTAETIKQTKSNDTYNLNLDENSIHETPHADTKKIYTNPHSNIAAQIKKFIFANSNEYKINNDNFQVANTFTNDQAPFCFLTSFSTINSDKPEKTAENIIKFSESPEPGLLSSTNLNKRKKSFTSDLSTVQLMKHRFEKPTCEMNQSSVDLKDLNQLTEIQIDSSLTTGKMDFIEPHLGNNNDYGEGNLVVSSRHSKIKTIWENNECLASSKINQSEVKVPISKHECIECLKPNGSSFISRQHEIALEDTYISTETYTNASIEQILSVESEMLNNNLRTVEKELSKVINISSEEIDREILLEIAEIDAMDSLDNAHELISSNYKNDQENSKLFLDLDEDQTDVLRIDNETMDLDVQLEIADVYSMPNHTLQGSDVEDNFANYFPKPRKLIRFDSFFLNSDISGGEMCNLEKGEKLDETSLEEVSLVGTCLKEDKALDEVYKLKPPEIACVVKPRLILVDPSLKDNSLLDDQELDDELQRELDNIDGVVQENTIDKSEKASVELSSSAIGFFSTQTDYEHVDSNTRYNLLDTDNNSYLESGFKDTRNLQHDMNKYEFFKDSSSYMYSSDNTVVNNYPTHHNELGSLEPSFDSLQSVLSETGEYFSDKLALIDVNNLSMSTESDGSDFNAWSSNVEFGDPTDTTDQEGMDFDLIISAPNLSEALKKLEAHIQDKGEDMQWLAPRTPSPSLQSLEKYFKDDVSCFDTEKFYVEVSGGVLPDKTDIDSKIPLDQGTCDSKEVIQVTPFEELLECSYAPGSKEAKECETNNQESESDSWIISPFQYPRVLLSNTEQMSIIIEEDDQKKSQPPSPLQTYHKNISLSSEQSIEESQSDKYSNRSDCQEHVEKEIDLTLEEFDRLITRPSVDESIIGLPNDESEENFNHFKMYDSATKYMSTKPQHFFECIAKDVHEINNDSITIANLAHHDAQLKDCIGESNNIESSTFQHFASVCEVDSGSFYSKVIQDGNSNTRQEYNVSEEIKFLLERNIDSISEDELNKLNVTERTTLWDMKLQRIQELDKKTIPDSGPKSLSNIKSGTVQGLISCFADNDETLGPPPCNLKTQYSCSKTAGQEKVIEGVFDSQKYEENNRKREHSPLKEFIDGGSVSVKPVSQWKAYWDDVINEQQMSSQKEKGKIPQIPTIQIFDNGENNPVSSHNNDVSHAKIRHCSYEKNLVEENIYIKNIVTDTSLSGSVIQNIKMFSECPTQPFISNNVSLNGFKNEGNSLSGFNTINGKESNTNSKIEAQNSNLSLLEPMFRTRSYSAGHLDTNVMASKEKSEKSTQESKTCEDVPIGQQNEFRIRFEKAKCFFKQLESSGPSEEVKKRDYRSMPKLDLVLPTNRKPSIDSDSGSDIKQQKRRDRYRNRKKKRKNSTNIQSAPTSDTETAKRIQAKDSFESFGGSVKSIKVSERFHVKDLFKDVSGKVGLFKGIPNQAAVLASLKSVDDERTFSPYQTDYIDPRSASLGNIPAGFQNEYPYLPTTPANQFRPRSALEFNLIPRCQLLDEDF